MGLDLFSLKKIVLSCGILCIASLAIWVVIRYDNQSAQALADQNDPTMDRTIYLEDLEFSSVCQVDDAIFAGGSEGLFKIRPSTGAIEEVLNDGLSFELVRAIVLSDQKQMWVGHGDGISVFENQKIIAHYDMDDGLPDNRVNALDSRDGKVYVATFGGVAIIDGTQVSALTTDNGLIMAITKTLMIDSRGDLWCGSYTAFGGGVTLFNQTSSEPKIQYFTTENGLSHNAITSITENEQGDVWIGNGSYTTGGASRYKQLNGQWQVAEVLTMDNGLIGEKIRHIHLDPHNNLWFCSESDGIAVFNSRGEIHYLTQASGLSDNEVKKIIHDHDGNLWLASRRGVTMITHQWLIDNIY